MYGKNPRRPFNRTGREKRKRVGASHHSTPELWLQTCFADHLNKSFRSCLCFADDEQCVKTFGKLFHQLFFFKARWLTTRVPLVPRAGAARGLQLSSASEVKLP